MAKNTDVVVARVSIVTRFDPDGGEYDVVYTTPRDMSFKEAQGLLEYAKTILWEKEQRLLGLDNDSGD